MLNDLSPKMPVRLLDDWEDVPKGYKGIISGEEFHYDPDTNTHIIIGVFVDFQDNDGHYLGTAGPIPVKYLERA